MSGAEEANTRIAIDGPAGSGKTTTGKLVATRFGFRFFDTGIMYRAATRMALLQGFALADEAAIVHSIVVMKGTNPAGPFDNRLMMIHTWVKSGDNWQLAAHQTTQLER